MSEPSADWCAGNGNLVICGTSMAEHSRRPLGLKWCFACRKRGEFDYIVMAPTGPSYYGPYAVIKCSNCGEPDGDLFPGWTREWEGD